MTTLKNLFYRVFWSFPFSFCSFPFLQHKKEKTKNAIFFSKTLIFDNPKFCKNTILTHCDTICVSKNVKKYYKTGKKNSKNNLDQFLTYSLDQFLTYKRPNLGPVFNSTAYIYIHTHFFMRVIVWMCVCVSPPQWSWGAVFEHIAGVPLAHCRSCLFAREFPCMRFLVMAVCVCGWCPLVLQCCVGKAVKRFGPCYRFLRLGPVLCQFWMVAWVMFKGGDVSKVSLLFTKLSVRFFSLPTCPSPMLPL